MQKIRPGTLAALLLGSILTPSPLLAASSIDAIRAAALTDTVAMDFTEGLTTEVGPRPAGTPQEARARDWTVAKDRKSDVAGKSVSVRGELGGRRSIKKQRRRRQRGRAT